MDLIWGALHNYGASTATILLTDSKFLELINWIKSESIWNDDLENQHQIALSIVLERT